MQGEFMRADLLIEESIPQLPDPGSQHVCSVSTALTPSLFQSLVADAHGASQDALSIVEDVVASAEQ